jgi:DNA-directed RNA polymerase subunit RPC12/RpoP
MIYNIDKHNSESSDRVINCESCGALVLLREAHKHVAFHERMERQQPLIISPSNTLDIGGVR